MSILGKLSSVALASARIFGNSLNPLHVRSGNKVLRTALIGQQVTSWYPTRIEDYGDAQFKDPQRERMDMKTARLRKKGKTVKKGEGKRASNKKK